MITAEGCMATHPHFDRIADRWQTRIAGQKEYGVIRDGNIFGANLTDSYLFHSEYERAHALRQQLCSRYDGCSFEEVFCGVETKTPFGPTHRITSETRIAVPEFDSEEIASGILHDLKLIHGIGEHTEFRLKNRGYESIRDLLRHPRFRSRAQAFLSVLASGDKGALMRWMTRWYPASHPSLLKTAGLHRKTDLVFLDIETLGLFSRPIILFGIGQLHHDSLAVSQYLLRDIHEEEAAISAIFSHMDHDSTALITFNGKAFDFPYLQDRASYYGLGTAPAVSHYDILHFARRRFRKLLPDCRLQTIEKHICGFERKDDVPSAMVPEFYETYMQTGNPGPLIPIVEHNRRDIITLAEIYSYLMEECHVGQ